MSAADAESPETRQPSHTENIAKRYLIGVMNREEAGTRDFRQAAGYFLGQAIRHTLGNNTLIYDTGEREESAEMADRLRRDHITRLNQQEEAGKAYDGLFRAMSAWLAEEMGRRWQNPTNPDTPNPSPPLKEEDIQRLLQGLCFAGERLPVESFKKELSASLERGLPSHEQLKQGPTQEAYRE